jgi:outer membrane protein OmpA-like peptidoglycan-associated protein
MLLTLSSLVAGCSTVSSMNPVNWWHRQEGGKIAEQRPAPPGADQAYPNMSTVPAKPEAPDAEALKKLTAALVADRTNAQHAAEMAPLADPSSPASSPSLFGVGTAPPPPSTANPPPGNPPPGNPPAGNPPAGTGSAGSPLASASIPAVTSPPPPATPPSAAPRKAVESAPLAAPPDAQQSQTPSPGGPQPSEAGAAGQPALPTGPPVRPAAAGAPPPPSPAEPTPMPAPAGGPSATIVFVEGASNLSPPAADEVKTFAAKRGNGTIAVTGFGDSLSSDPDAQSAALNLGLSRAQSIVEALKQAGVPGNAIRVSAEASGRGAALRLLQ